ncbi:hypothetical protein V1Y59_04055 [Gordonia sp. PKS22-38]|uniref:Uncharacterized protein n=1 Tax=Gordonia prachuapensis TaxID=3115651 RepID=A0ABU7MPH8_9ACTN|nr:hypothetical protein [Gordonia sp. PKS22-38]
MGIREFRRRRRKPRHLAESHPRGFSYYFGDMLAYMSNTLVSLPSVITFSLGLLTGFALSD